MVSLLEFRLKTFVDWLIRKLVWVWNTVNPSFPVVQPSGLVQGKVAEAYSR